MDDDREFGCSRERKQHEYTCARTLGEEGGCREGCSEDLGLHPEGDVDLGLRRGVTAPLWLWGRKVGYAGAAAHSPRLQLRRPLRWGWRK